MARELNYTIGQVFEGRTTSRGVSYYSRGVMPIDTKRIYMEIPINKPVFELPLFALGAFKQAIVDKKFNNDAIIATLRTIGKVPKYKTPARYMKDLLYESYERDKLVELEVEAGSTSLFYYVTCGAIFDHHFKPLMLCSWIMERAAEEDGTFEYNPLNAILRIDPHCYLSKDNSLEKFIVNKLPTVALQTEIFRPYGNCFRNIPEGAPLKIEIADCPFTLKTADVPSVSTTSKRLLQVAIDHLDEIIQ